MTDEIIDNLHKLLQPHTATMKKVSRDESNNIYMSDSELKVINFDRIPNEYCRGKGWSCVPNSNDALYIDINSNWYFIEFKNGRIDTAKIYRKIYDSIIMLIDMDIIPNLEFSRKNIEYILVYEPSKLPKVQASKSRTENASYLLKLANKEEKLFDVEKFEKYLLRETHTYSKEFFKEKFVLLREKEEGIS
jgi:hypothetical protein